MTVDHVPWYEDRFTVPLGDLEGLPRVPPSVMRERLADQVIPWEAVVEITRDTYHRGIRPSTRGMIDGTEVYSEHTGQTTRFVFSDDDMAYIIL